MEELEDARVNFRRGSSFSIKDGSKVYLLWLVKLVYVALLLQFGPIHHQAKSSREVWIL